MKKTILKLVVALCITLSVTACSSGKETSDIDPIEKYGCDTINVYNCGEYIC